MLKKTLWCWVHNPENGDLGTLVLWAEGFFPVGLAHGDRYHKNLGIKGSWKGFKRKQRKCLQYFTAVSSLDKYLYRLKSCQQQLGTSSAWPGEKQSPVHSWPVWLVKEEVSRGPEVNQCLLINLRVHVCRPLQGTSCSKRTSRNSHKNKWKLTLLKMTLYINYILALKSQAFLRPMSSLSMWKTL